MTPPTIVVRCHISCAALRQAYASPIARQRDLVPRGFVINFERERYKLRCLLHRRTLHEYGA
jgi:hypothetical protein